MRNFIWFTIDLRLNDNLIIQKACELGEKFIPVFIIDPKLFCSENTSESRLSFLVESLIDLNIQLKSYSSELHILEGNPEEVWERINTKNQVQKVIVAKDYSRYSKRRQNKVAEILKKSMGELIQITNQVIFDDSAGILNASNEPIKVFTNFKTKWLSLYSSLERKFNHKSLDNLFETLSPIELEGVKVIDISSLNKYLIPESLFKGGETSANAQWDDFKEARIFGYNKVRNMLDIDGTSKLSPHLRWGTLSPQKVVRDCVEMIGENFVNFRSLATTNKAGIETFLSEIIWREFYKYILAHYPEVENSNFQKKFDDIKWEFDEAKFKAWCEGKTGYPVVDACMRQLNTEGWMHNRGRMIVASFLCKDLHIDWKKGEKYFQSKLVDYDLSSNNGGWQWTAGTGTDASPYFRIFNPIEQGKKFDPEGTFIKKIIPELRNVPVEYLFEPWTMDLFTQESASCNIGVDYPAPIVSHADARKKTLILYKVQVPTL